MAQSFFQPGVDCDVGVIQSRSSDPWTQWNLFCDCMFQPGSDDWKKCVVKHCATPWGCARPWGVTDPFNVDVGLLAAPWTDVGAATRRIPKRNASVAYTVAGATTFRPDEWTPLSLWQMYWNNPAHYALLVGQLSVVLPLIPVAGPIIASAIRAAGAAPPVQLIPAALVETAAKKLDVGKAILEPMAKGSIKNLGTALSYLGNCGVGANIPCGAGIAVKRVAQDQIDTGMINGYDPMTRAVVVFLAKEGDALVEQLAKAVIGGLNRALATQVFGVLKSGFLAAKTVALSVNDQGAVDALTLLHKAAVLGYVIADGMEQKKTAAQIADEACDQLLGFRPSVFFDLLKTNASAATAMVQSAQRTQGSGFEKAMAVVDAVGQGLQKIATVILDFERQLGTSLGDLSSMFMSGVAALTGTRQAIESAQAQVLNATPASASARPTATASTAGARTPTILTPEALSRILLSNAAPPTGAKRMSSTMTLLSAAGGGIVGAVAGGPVGAAVGAAITGAGALLLGSGNPAPAPDLGGQGAAATAPTVVRVTAVDPATNQTVAKDVVAFSTTTQKISTDLQAKLREAAIKAGTQQVGVMFAGFGEAAPMSPVAGALLGALTGALFAGRKGALAGAAIGGVVSQRSANAIAKSRLKLSPSPEEVIATKQLSAFHGPVLTKSGFPLYANENLVAAAQKIAKQPLLKSSYIAPEPAPAALPMPIAFVETKSPPVTPTVDMTKMYVTEVTASDADLAAAASRARAAAAVAEEAARAEAARKEKIIAALKAKEQADLSTPPAQLVIDKAREALNKVTPGLPPDVIVEVTPSQPDALVVTDKGPVPVSVSKRFPVGLALGAGGLAAALLWLSKR